MRTWIISDTHGRHRELSVPADVEAVIHAGDWSNDRDPVRNEVEVRDFLDWFSELDIPVKIAVAGNHDTSVSARLVTTREIRRRGIRYLEHSGATERGLRIFGSPYTPRYGSDWAFMLKRNRMHTLWSTIPDDLDVLITHGPPKGVLDRTFDRDGSLLQVGCKALRNRVLQSAPRFHIFGHLHSEKGVDNYGIFRDNDPSTFVNASCSYLRKELPFHPGFVLDLKKEFE